MSDLLNQASLVMVPSGYKEDTVYSVVPSDGSGDLSFTRASNGTRINSAGLVEVVPWNLVSYSSDLSNAYWTKRGFTQIATNATAPDGSATAYKIQENNTDNNPALVVLGSVTPNGANTFFVWLKGDSNYTLNLSTNGGVPGSTINITTSWQLYSVTQTNAPYNGPHIGGFSTIARNSGIMLYVWHPQLNIGSTAKPYFPTTDRLNVPRLTYQNGGGGCPSLLLEKQSTNLVTYSEQFDNAAWSLSDLTITANNAISPDGTQNADLISSTSSVGLAYQVKTLSGLHTISAFFKAGTSVLPRLQFYDSGAGTSGIGSYNLSTQSVSTSGLSSTGTITSCGNGWYRCTLTANLSGSSINCFIGVDENAKNLLAWGAQVEAGAYATSYIPTTSSSATRVVDACSKTGISSLIGQTEGVIFVQGSRFALDSVKSALFAALEKTSSGATMRIQYSQSLNILYADIFDGTSFSAQLSGPFVAAGQTFKAALAYKNNDFAFAVNGSIVATDTSGSVPATDDLKINTSQYNNLDAGLQESQLVLFKTRLTNSELIALTTL